MQSRILALGACALTLLATTSIAGAQTIRIAEHRQARIDALNTVVPAIEESLGIEIEVIEYPAPERDYLTRLLTELRAGNAPDLFTAPRGQDVADMVASGYLAPITPDIQAWTDYDQLFDVAVELVTSYDGEIYVLPQMLNVQQIYFRRDILEEHGISTEQPATWADLLDRAREIREVTGAYALLFPSGVTWGGGAFGEGFQYLMAGTPTPELAGEDGTLNLRTDGVRDALNFYADLINDDLMPVQPLLGPEPWVIPKYEMFPAGELVATTCGSWCYIYDWGPESRNPIPDVTQAVGTWAMPGQDGGVHVMVDIDSPWAVNADSAELELATQVLFEIGSVEAAVAYAERLGNIPARRDAADNPDFQALTALVPVHANVENGTFLRTAPGFSVLAEGVARATDALLRQETDADGAHEILVEYVVNFLGDDAVN